MTIEPDRTLESVEEYWDAQPCNVRHSTVDGFTIEYFREVERKKFFVESHIENWVEFQKWEGKRVLDVGCGIGTVGAVFARNGANYTGVDLSSNSLAIAQKRFEVEGLSGTFRKINVETIGDVLDGESFDVIFSFGVLHHTPNPFIALQQLRRLAEENTVFLGMVYHRDSYKQALIDVEIAEPEAQPGCPIAYTYSLESWASLLEASGWRADDLEVDHIFRWQIEPYKLNIYVPEPWFASMPPEIFAALEKKLGWHLLFKARPA